MLVIVIPFYKNNFIINYNLSVYNQKEGEMQDIELFGGALACKLPSTFRDISDFVPVPDSQEIYQDMTKPAEGSTEVVANFGQLIVEILDQTEKNDEEALPYLFNDLAEVNHSADTQI